MSKHPSLLQEFRSFCFQNKITDIDKAVEYFAVFGGMGWRVDTNIELDKLIEEKILKNYRYIHADITAITKSNKLYHQLMSALATGDGREHSAFKKARVDRAEGEKAIDFLIDNDLLLDEPSVLPPFDEDEEVSDKIEFIQPFMKFWFASVSPFYKGIKEGDFKEFYKFWNERKNSFSEYIYQKLAMELVKNIFQDDSIKDIGSYWDRSVEIDIVAKTNSGKTIAGLCKFSKSKASNSDLTRLKSLCEDASLEVDVFMIFSKNKFSTELSKQKGSELILLAPRNLKPLIDSLDKSDLLSYSGKKY